MLAGILFILQCFRLVAFCRAPLSLRQRLTVPYWILFSYLFPLTFAPKRKLFLCDNDIKAADYHTCQNIAAQNRSENIDKPLGAIIPYHCRNQQQHRSDSKARAKRFAELALTEYRLSRRVMSNKQRSSFPFQKDPRQHRKYCGKSINNPSGNVRIHIYLRKLLFTVCLSISHKLSFVNKIEIVFAEGFLHFVLTTML